MLLAGNGVVFDDLKHFEASEIELIASRSPLVPSNPSLDLDGAFLSETLGVGPNFLLDFRLGNNDLNEPRPVTKAQELKLATGSSPDQPTTELDLPAVEARYVLYVGGLTLAHIFLPLQEISVIYVERTFLSSFHR
jgi:hypothetical protein